MSRQRTIGIVAAVVFGLFIVIAIASEFAAAENPNYEGFNPAISLIRVLFVATFATVAVAVYFLPTIAAVLRDHQNAIPIALINATFGWTMLGWIGCAAWAFSSDAKPQTIRVIHEVRENYR